MQISTPFPTTPIPNERICVRQMPAFCRHCTLCLSLATSPQTVPPKPMLGADHGTRSKSGSDSVTASEILLLLLPLLLPARP